MSEDKKPRIPNITTPRVRLVWPSLTAPDYGTEKFPDPDGSFRTKFVMKLDDPNTRAFLAKLEPLIEQAKEEAQARFDKLKPEQKKKHKHGYNFNDPYTELLDKETEEPTGEIQFSVKRKASWIAKKGKKAGQRVHGKLAIFDGMGEPIVWNEDKDEKPPAIFGGTIAKISVSPSIYFVDGTATGGLSLGLESVQIVKLSQGRKSAADYGFEAEEDGYAYEQADEDETASGGDEKDSGDAAPNSDF